MRIASTMDDGPHRQQTDALVRRLADDVLRNAARGGITPRERESLAEVAHGGTNRQIAAKLGIG